MSLKKKLNNISCKEYCTINNYKYSLIQKELPQEVYIPNYSENPEDTKSISVKFPEIYIAELNNVNLIGSNYIIYDDNDYCIYDLPLMDSENKFDLRCASVIGINKYNTFIDYVDSSIIIEEGIMLISGVPHNYSHFQIEIASKLCLINEQKEYSDLPLIVDEICLTIPQFKEELEMLNKQGRTIIPLRRGCSYKVKKLIYISELGIYPCNIKPGFPLKYEDVVINDLGIKLLNKNLAIQSNIFRKLYISRRNSAIPRLQNQDAVEQIFKEFGYEIIFPEQMSFHDQLKIFSEAEFIAGASGAGLANIIFANKNSKIISMQSKTVYSTWYSNIAGILKLKAYFLDVDLYRNSPILAYQCGFTVNGDSLRSFLNRLT